MVKDGEWQGKVSAKVRGATAEQVWPLIADFFGLDKWHPGVDTCRRLDGPGGAIRYCERRVRHETTGEIIAVRWAKERLIETDPIERRLSYEVQENNVGFRRWIATAQVVSSDAKGQNGNYGCEIIWLFGGEPMQGWTYQQIVAYYDSSLTGIAKNIEHALLSIASHN